MIAIPWSGIGVRRRRSYLFVSSVAREETVGSLWIGWFVEIYSGTPTTHYIRYFLITVFIGTGRVSATVGIVRQFSPSGRGSLRNASKRRTSKTVGCCVGQK